MNTALRDEVLSLPADEKFDVMMALLDSLPDDDLPVLNDERLASLDEMLQRFRNYPDPSVQYDHVMERLRSRRQSNAT